MEQIKTKTGNNLEVKPQTIWMISGRPKIANKDNSGAYTFSSNVPDGFYYVRNANRWMKVINSEVSDINEEDGRTQK
jgi:hypothetical protein